jgi:hypothetical protein
VKFAITSVATALYLIALVLEDVRGTYGRKVSEFAIYFSGKVEKISSWREGKKKKI